MTIDLDRFDAIEDTDLLACTDTDGVTYKVTGAQFMDMLDTKKPWEGLGGGIWHVLNHDRYNAVRLQNGPYLMWDIEEKDGNYTWSNERWATQIEKTATSIFVTDPVTQNLFRESSKTFEFKELTDTSLVTSMKRMFYKTSNMSGLELFDTSNVTDMTSMFYKSTANANLLPISDWDVSKVTVMSNMFTDAVNFDQDIGRWNMVSAVNLASMFVGATVFNQDISPWNVSNVTDMTFMFEEAEEFNQDLSQWCVKKITSSPLNFAKDAYNWTLPKPVWNSCPRGEDKP
jgi:surface protein